MADRTSTHSRALTSEVAKYQGARVAIEEPKRGKCRATITLHDHSERIFFSCTGNDRTAEIQRDVRKKIASMQHALGWCSYPQCKCINHSSTSQPVPNCPLGLDNGT